MADLFRYSDQHNTVFFIENDKEHQKVSPTIENTIKKPVKYSNDKTEVENEIGHIKDATNESEKEIARDEGKHNEPITVEVEPTDLHDVKMVKSRVKDKQGTREFVAIEVETSKVSNTSLNEDTVINDTEKVVYKGVEKSG